MIHSSYSDSIYGFTEEFLHDGAFGVITGM
jgi:hypothetical protein